MPVMDLPREKAGVLLSMRLDLGTIMIILQMDFSEKLSLQSKQVNKMKYDASFFLRFGLAFVFIYVSISAFLIPEAWIGYLPNFLGSSVTKGYFLFGHDVFALLLGLWLLTGWKTFWAALIAAVFLAGVSLTNLGVFLVVFRGYHQKHFLLVCDKILSWLA